MKSRRLYIISGILIWMVCVVAFFILWDVLFDYYEYVNKAAVPKHVMKQIYFYRGILAAAGFGILALWLFYRGEKKHCEEKIRRQRVMVLEKFSSFVAHEIRNPLTSLNLNAELVQDSISKIDDPKMEELRSLMKAIIEGVTHLANTTEQYLTFRNKDMKIKRFNAGPALEELVFSLKPKAEAQGVGLQLKLTPESGAELRGDRKRFQMAVQRLVENAFESMPQGGTVTIDGRSKKRSFKLKVSDTGVGMTREVQNHLFEPFFTTKLKSAGLGLCLVRQIVGEFQASVSYQSSVGKGTSFQIRFPLIESKSKKGEVQ